MIHRPGGLFRMILNLHHKAGWSILGLRPSIPVTTIVLCLPIGFNIIRGRDLNVTARSGIVAQIKTPDHSGVFNQ